MLDVVFGLGTYTSVMELSGGWEMPLAYHNRWEK
jgi:hypothetical protein